MATKKKEIEDNNDILYSILNDITATQTVSALLEIIFSKLKKVIDFDDVGLFHVLEDGRHRDLTAASELTFGASKEINQQIGKKWLSSEPSFEASLIELHIQNLSSFFSKYPDHPHLQILTEAGLKQFISKPLIKDKKVFGLFVLWSKTENTYTKKDVPLFSKIADMIAVALSNILDREALMEEKNFKETLLTITSTLSTVSTGQFLIRTILDDIKDIFNFYDIGLFVFTENQMYLEDWAVKYEVLNLSDGSIKMSQSEKVNTRLEVAKGSNLEWELEILKKAKGPKIIDLTEMAGDFPDYEQSEIIISTGYRDSMQTLLKYGGETLGFFYINALQKDFFAKSQFSLFQAIADQIAIAVSNIKSSEALVAEKNFKETLLSISEVVAATRDRGELLKIIFNQLKPLFDFCDTGLFVLSENGQEVTDWSVLDEVANPSESNTYLLHNNYATMSYPDSALEWAITDIVANDYAVIYNYEELKNRFPQWPHFSVLLEHGIKECISAVLKNGGRIIGMLNFNALKVNHFNAGHIPLFTAIADQLSVAVNNILSQEQLLKEKNFKETLLAISETIATIQDRKELFKVIFEKINPVIPIDDVGLLILDESGEHWKDLAVVDNFNQTRGGAELANSGFVDFLPVDNLVRLSTEQTGIISIEEMMQKFPENPFVPIMAKDMKEFLYTPLKVGNTTIGSIFFDSETGSVYTKEMFPLFKAIADQLAVAVSNVLANEELLKEKYFKETLLSISKAVSEVQNRNQLLKIIFEKIKMIIDFDHAGLFIIDYDKDVFYEILEEGTLDELQDEQARNGRLGPFAYSGNHPDALMYIDKVSILDLKEHSEIYTNSQLEPVLEYGLKKIIVAPLQHNNQRIGFLCFLAKDENQFSKDLFPLVKAISNQVSIAVNNVLANEKLITEKEFSTTLLHITEAVAQVKDAKDLYKTIFKHIKPVFPYDELGLFVVDETTDTHYELITVSDLDRSIAQSLTAQNLGGPQQKFKHSGTSVEWLMENGPIAKNLEEIDKIVTHPQHQFMLEGGLKNIIGGPMSIGGKPFGMVCFNATTSNFYGAEHLILFKSIAEQISVAVSNILSRQQIIEREQEKSTLLEITSAVSKIRNLPDFLTFVMTKLKPIFEFYDVGVFLLTNNGEYHYDVASVLTKTEEANQLNYFSTVDSTLIPQKDSAIEWAIEKIEIANKPVLFDFKDLVEMFPDYYQFETYELIGEGYRDCLAANLKVGDEILGMFCINALEKDFFKKEQFSLFQNVTEQLSVAVSNILANNNIVEREQEKATLLEITSAVSKIRNLPDFLSFVANGLKSIFNFYDIGVFLLRENGKYNVDLAAIDLKISPSIGNEIFYLSKEKFINHEGSLIEWMMSEIAKESSPVLFDFVDLVEKYPDYYQFELLDIVEEGYRDCLAANLKIGDEVFGMFCINALEKDFFKKEQFSLFQNVTEQLSVAVSNILANEELIEEKKLKETLLDVSEAVSKTRSRKQLYDAIISILRPQIGFADAVLCLIDNDAGTHSLPLTAADETTMQHPLYNEVTTKNMPLEGSPMVEILEGDDVGKLLLSEWLLKYPDYPGFLLMKDVGLQFSITLKLKHQQTDIGILFIHFTSPQVLDNFNSALYGNLRNTISVALNNILAQESLENEKGFSETLLEITEALAVAEDAVQLYKAIDTVVKKLIPFDQVGVLILDKSEEYHYELINEDFVNHISGSDKKVAPLEKQTLYEHKGTSVEWLANNGPTITTMDFLVKNTAHPRHSDMVNAGVKELLSGPLINEGKPIGMLAFKLKEEGVFNEQHIVHYKSVAEQVSICVANILSKKEILWKSSIQDLELKLSNILTKENPSNDKWAEIFQEFKTLIPFSFATVYKVTDGILKSYTYQWITPREHRQLSQENLVEITKLSTNEISKAEKGFVQFAQKEQNSINTAIVPKASKMMMEALGLQSVLSHKMNLNKKNTEVYFYMFSKNTEQYSIRHLGILNGVKNTFRISLENMFSAFSIKEMSEQLQLEKTYLESVVKETYNFENMIGESEAMRDVFNQITEVSNVDATTLILGETGTGKELIARAIHENSSRKDRVLVKVNCAAIPSQIVESELFGHEKGAFTGAFQQRIGKFELANNGTIFLDEIGEMPLELQTKLLRVIQEREVERLGSNTTIKLDIRIIAATNRNLTQEIVSGIFRADLFYRLNGYPIQVPPLRARGEDVLLLADFFARQFSERYGLAFKGFTQNTQTRFKKYEWPGNVRELQNIIEQAIISQKGKVLEVHPGQSNRADFEWFENDNQGENGKTALLEDFNMDDIKSQKDALEREYILKVLEKTKWRVSGKNGAARILDIAPTTLESRMRKLDIKR